MPRAGTALAIIWTTLGQRVQVAVDIADYSPLLLSGFQDYKQRQGRSMRKHRFLSVFSKTCLMMTLLLSARYAGAVVNSTQSRLVFNENSIAETLVLVNSERAPALVQVWSDDNDPLAQPDNLHTPLVVVPPLFKLEPGESRNLRVMLSSRQEIAAGRERVYWLNIYQIPPNTQSDGEKGKKVILPLRIRLKVFVRPAGLKAPDENIGESLIFTLKKGSSTNRSLLITNPTPYNMTLGELRLGGKQLTTMMIAPGASTAVPLSPASASGLLSWSVIDDYGKQIAYTRQL